MHKRPLCFLFYKPEACLKLQGKREGIEELALGAWLSVFKKEVDWREYRNGRLFSSCPELIGSPGCF